jgi:hypothetical protein
MDVGKGFPLFIVSFATPTYEVEAYKLLDDMRVKKIPHEVHFIQGLENWMKANHFKAVFIKEMLLKHKQPIVWLDADMEILQNPGLFDEIECDIAVNFFKDQQLCGGVMYFNYNPQTLALIDAWIAQNQVNPDSWESENLNGLLKDPGFKHIVKLPREYCTFDLCEDQANAVLWSRQASRRLKDVPL